MRIRTAIKARDLHIKFHAGDSDEGVEYELDAQDLEQVLEMDISLDMTCNEDGQPQTIKVNGRDVSSVDEAFAAILIPGA